MVFVVHGRLLVYPLGQARVIPFSQGQTSIDPHLSVEIEIRIRLTRLKVRSRLMSAVKPPEGNLRKAKLQGGWLLRCREQRWSMWLGW